LLVLEYVVGIWTNGFGMWYSDEPKFVPGQENGNLGKATMEVKSYITVWRYLEVAVGRETNGSAMNLNL
jgi:hypothetical protein